MDIIKYLKKANITVKQITSTEIVFLIKDREKTFKIKDLEQHLFFCLLDIIEE